jgi:hypothetical protein
MTDDTVTTLPPQKKPTRRAADILASVKGEWKETKAKEFKNAAQGLMKEIESLKKNLLLKEAELQKMVDEFDADNS